MTSALISLRNVITANFPWERWEQIISDNEITIDRPRRSHHPSFPEIIYPINYGFINGTRCPDGDEVDVFVGTARTGLVALMVTEDHRKGDREMKLIYNCSPEEVYLVNGFINFAPDKMQGLLVMRQPMHELWKRVPTEQVTRGK